jgi:chromate transporter
MSWITFLKDVFKVALNAFGGPEAHYGIFSRYLVDQKKYLSEDELLQLIALHSIVSGPTSTQTIVAIGYKVGGPILALLTFLVWALPAMLLMIAFAIFFPFIKENDQYLPLLTYLPPLAIGFMIYGSYSITKKSLKKIDEILLFSAMMFLGYVFESFGFIVFPILLLLGGIFYTSIHYKELKKVSFMHPISWTYPTIVLMIGLLLYLLVQVTSDTSLVLFEAFYRYGYSVIGGGQVVIPMMIKELVDTQAFLTIGDFLSGYAIDQAVPGPLFSFAAFVSAMAYETTFLKILGGLLGGFAIFIPGILLVFFVYPIWKQVKNVPTIQLFLKGVIISASSIIVLITVIQFVRLPLFWDVWLVAILSSLLLISKKIPPPWLVVMTLLIGLIV